MLDEVSPVAVKFLNPGVTPVSRQRFAAEVDLLRAMRDSSIVSFLGAWLQDDMVFMVSRCTDVP